MTKISNFKQNSSVNKEGIRTGFNNRDILEVDRAIRYEPALQVFDDELLDTELPEHRHYYCAKDKSLLTYINGSDTVCRCDECSTYYDTKIQDTPLKDVTDYRLKPYSDLQYYPTYDENDPSITFIEGIDLHNTIEIEGLETRPIYNQRVQHINLMGSSFSEALIKGALTSKSRAQT